jgi:hypothetical protein
VEQLHNLADDIQHDAYSDGDDAIKHAAATNATLNVMLKDGPFIDVKALLITFSDVNAHLSGGNFTSLPFVSGASRMTPVINVVSVQ